MRFNRSDRLVLLFLFAFILAVWGGVLLDRWFLQPRGDLVSLDEAGMDSLEAAWGVEVRSGSGGMAAVETSYYAVPVSQPETFPFDPNTADSTALLRLGLAPWQVRSIYKYRAMGGRYHRPEDFKRVPGMTPEVWNRLAPAVRIGESFRYYDREALAREGKPVGNTDGHRTEGSADGRTGGSAGGRTEESAAERAEGASSDSVPRYPHQEKFTELVHLDLNTVDSTTLKKVPGIASYRARQILRYRDRLGGFVSAEQLSEIENLPLELQAWFDVQTPVYRKLNLNTATIGELARHPYIGSARAKAIANYRRAQGRLTSLADLSLLSDFPADVCRRLEPYVEF